MKRLISVLMTLMLVLTSCTKAPHENVNETKDIVTEVTKEEKLLDVINERTFSSISDEEYLDYIEDSLYADILSNIDSEEYFVENVSAIYVSKEYLEELEYNSKKNIYFGYTLDELDEAFEGRKYMFTLGDDNTTVVKEMETLPDENTYLKNLKNMAIGTGVILVCVTISVATASAVPAISAIFAVSAKTATVCSVGIGGLGGVYAGIAKGYETGEFDEALKAAADVGSEGFKWGAIIGAVAGGGAEATALKGMTMNGLKMNEAAKIQKESKYAANIIKQFHSMEEYNVYKDAGLFSIKVNGKDVLMRNIDMSYVSEWKGTKVTNLERMKAGLSPIESSVGKPYEVHHIGQKKDGSFAILTPGEHEGFSKVLHIPGKESEIDRTAFATERKKFWKTIANIYESSMGQ